MLAAPMRAVFCLFLLLEGMSCKSEVDEYQLSPVEKRQVEATKNTISAARSVAARFLQDQKRCPTISDVERGFPASALPVDAWGHVLIVICPSHWSDGGVDLVSKGKDGRENTADDIRSWEIYTPQG